MTEQTFMDRLRESWRADRFVCVGLDSDISRLPARLSEGGTQAALRTFNEAIVDATRDVAAAYKPNIAFYELCGPPGMEALAETIRYIHKAVPSAPVILDAKRADIDNTNIGYVTALFDQLEADAVTVHPYLGGTALKPFLDRHDRGVFVLCRTSNASAPEFQDLETPQGLLYEVVAQHVARDWNLAGNCGLVVGATYPEELRRVRAIAPSLPLLIPGVGAQGGELEQTVANALDTEGAGFIINASRSIIFASKGSDFADAAATEAHRLHESILAARERILNRTT